MTDPVIAQLLGTAPDIDGVPLRTCRVCGEDWPLDGEFWYRAKGYYLHTCKACSIDRVRLRYASQPKPVREARSCPACGFVSKGGRFRRLDGTCTQPVPCARRSVIRTARRIDAESQADAAVGRAIWRALDVPLAIVTLGRDGDAYICETRGQSGKAFTIEAAIADALGDER